MQNKPDSAKQYSVKQNRQYKTGYYVVSGS